MDARAVFPDCPQNLATLIDEGLRQIVPGLTVHVGAPADEAETVARLAGHRVCMLFSVYVSDHLLDACPDIRSITYLSTGIGSHVDSAAAAARGVRVRNVTGYADRAIAEHVLALTLDGARGVSQMDRTIRGGSWKDVCGIELAGRTLGVVGLGDTGRATASLAAALGMSVVAYSRSGPKQGVPARVMPLDEVLRQSDVISLHLALNAATCGIIDPRRLRLMRRGAILINTARAGLVDDEALIAALQDGHLGHAALDVFDQEPLPPSHPLTRLNNVTLTAHSAWFTRDAGFRLLCKGMETLREEIARLD